MIPITLLTGFLGSGKTTLLSRELIKPNLPRAAVVINEFGTVGLDHDLIEPGADTVVELANGCLCCRVQSDLARTLVELDERRRSGDLAFERVVIETSGLADPGPVLRALMTDRLLAARYAIAHVVTVVDAASGQDTLAAFEEARRQVALADTLVLTKLDIAGENAGALRDDLRRFNRLSPIIDGDRWRGEDMASATHLPPDPSAAGLPSPVAGHERAISSVTLFRHAPVDASAILLFLEGLAAQLGPRLLRLKGLVAVAQAPDRPMLLESVQHVYYSPSWLERWPSADRRTRIVLIGEGYPAGWPESLLAALEAEVRQVSLEATTGPAARDHETCS